MAGFDAVFRFKTYDRALVVVCVDAMRRRARKFGIRFKSSVGDDVAFVEMHSNTYQIDIFVERIRRDLPTIAEAAPSPRTPEARRKTAAGLVEIITRYRFSAYDYSDDAWIPTLRARSKPVQGSIHGIYPDVASGLADRMFVTMDLLASWHFEEVPAPILIEEVHTASELLMKAALPGRTSRFTYAQLVGHALENGVFDYFGLDRHVRLPEQAARSRAHQQADAELLISLKDERRQVKHDGKGDAEAWLRAHFWDVVRVLEGLSLKARDTSEGDA